MRSLLLLAAASVAAAAFSWPTIGNPSTMSCCANMDGSISSLFTTYGLQLKKKRDDASGAGADESLGAPVDIKAGRFLGSLNINVKENLYLRLLGDKDGQVMCYEKAPIGAFLFRDPRDQKLNAVVWNDGSFVGADAKKQCATYKLRMNDFPKMCVGNKYRNAFSDFRDTVRLDFLTSILRFYAPCHYATLSVHPITCQPWALTLNMTGVKAEENAMPPEGLVFAEYPSSSASASSPGRASLRGEHADGASEAGVTYSKTPLDGWVCDGHSGCHCFEPGHPIINFGNSTHGAPPKEWFGVPSWCEVGLAAWKEAQAAAAEQV